MYSCIDGESTSILMVTSWKSNLVVLVTYAQYHSHNKHAGLYYSFALLFSDLSYLHLIRPAHENR